MRVEALILGAALGVAVVATGARAQDRYYGPYYGAAPQEEVIVRSPRRTPQRSAIGAPIVNVAFSRSVRFDDLDLRTGWGVHVLRDRIGRTARTLCRDLDDRYPVSYDGSDSSSWPVDSRCYRDAVADAMEQARPAIEAARSGE